MSAFVGTKLDEEIKSGVFMPAMEKENLMEEKVFLVELIFRTAISGRFIHWIPSRLKAG